MRSMIKKSLQFIIRAVMVFLLCHVSPAFAASLQPNTEFSVAAPVSGLQRYPAAAYAGGVHLVVWQEGHDGWGAQANMQIRGARISDSGTMIDNSSFVIADAPDLREKPAIATDSNIFLVVWQDIRNGQDYDIYAARVGTDGIVIDPGGIAIATGTGNQAAPAVSFDGTNFVVVWMDNRYVPQSYHIRAARVSSAGAVLDSGGIFISGPSSSAVQQALNTDNLLGVPFTTFPTIACTDGECLVGWINSWNGWKTVSTYMYVNTEPVISASNSIMSLASNSNIFVGGMGGASLDHGAVTLTANGSRQMAVYSGDQGKGNDQLIVAGVPFSSTIPFQSTINPIQIRPQSTGYKPAEAADAIASYGSGFIMFWAESNDVSPRQYVMNGAIITGCNVVSSFDVFPWSSIYRGYPSISMGDNYGLLAYEETGNDNGMQIAAEIFVKTNPAWASTIVPNTTTPVTLALPSGGAYNAGISASLITTDGTAAGCDKTYYTTDGTTPTTSSAIYSGPIAIATNTVLKYFSVNASGKSEAVNTQIYTIDSTPPNGTVTINGGALYTSSPSVTLTFTCSDNSATGCVQMQLSNDNINWSTPVAYVNAKIWPLTSGDGSKSVYARFRDAAGNWSGASSNSIVLDSKAPVTTASPAGGISGANVTIALTCNDAGSGCSKTYYTTDGTAPTASSNIYSGTIPIAGTTTLKYFSIDLAGNSEAIKTQTYTIDSIPPAGTITINNGAPYANKTSVALTLSCTDNIGCVQMELSSDNINWSTPLKYVTSSPWSLTAGDGPKTLYVKYMDNAGNWSQPASAAIILDATAPSDGTLNVTTAAGTASLNWFNFSDALSGIASYNLVYSTTGNPPPNCNGGMQIYYGPGNSYIQPGLLSGTIYYYRLCAIDKAGNISSGATSAAKP